MDYVNRVSPESGAVYFKLGKITNTGKKRKSNEDCISTCSFTISEKDALVDICLFTVCDGMGGARAGSKASRLAVRAINGWIINEILRSNLAQFEKIIDAALKGSIKQAHTFISKESERNEDSRGMGTTAVIALTKSNAAYIYHIGDSRCYHLKKNNLKQVTEDHSLFNVLNKKGSLSSKEKKNFVNRNVITHAIGRNINLGNKNDSVKKIPLENGDSLLLCSDGLTLHLQDNEIKQIMKDSSHPEQACRGLMHLALERGGEDNISIVILKCLIG